jgi:glutathione S-transferase
MVEQPKRGVDSLPRLITIPISHYCEKARWALDRTGVAYVNRGHMPLLHWASTVPRGGRSAPFLITSVGTFKDSR